VSIQVDACIRAYNRGKLEYILGLGIEACPHKGTSIYRAFYEAGWHEQEKESTSDTRRGSGRELEREHMRWLVANFDTHTISDVRMTGKPTIRAYKGNVDSGWCHTWEEARNNVTAALAALHPADGQPDAAADAADGA
jgi:ribosome modulation factor